MCQSPTKTRTGSAFERIERINTLKRTSPLQFQILTPDHQRYGRAEYDDADCETPKVFPTSMQSALEFGLVSRAVPQPQPLNDFMDCENEPDEEPMTPRAAMLPVAPSEPPALKIVNALSPNWERRNHMFDEGFVLSPVKRQALSSPGNVSGVSGLYSGTSSQGSWS